MMTKFNIRTNSHQSNKDNVEILCIGTELLLGNIVNSNSRWLAEELSSLGLPHYRQIVIGDNIDRVKKTILECSKRSRFLITTGGLGPTPDDITTEAIASAFNTPLIEKEGVWEDIQKKMNQKNKETSLINRKQAFFPDKAILISNPTGTAPGMIWSPKKDFTILTFPGVPSELKEMWIGSAIPWFKKKIKKQKIYFSRMLRFTGITESKLVESISDLLSIKNPTIAPYANIGEVKLRLTAVGKDQNEAKKILKPIENTLINRAGLNFYGFDNQSLSEVVINLLRVQKATVSIAESCTGGSLGAELSKVPGASDVFLGGVIAYQNSVKEKFLGVPKNTLENHGAVSKEVVEAMAEGARERFRSDWSIAISGIAGPGGGSITKPVGLIHIAISGPNGTKTTEEIFNPFRGRNNIQKLSVVCSLNKLRLLILTQS